MATPATNPSSRSPITLAALEWHYPDALLQQAKAVKLLATDVDGVMTAGHITWDAQGVETKAFNVKDGWGLRHIRKLGVKTAIITARQSAIVAKRGAELDFDAVHQAVSNKWTCLETLLTQYGVQAHEVAYMGDDWPDMPILEKVGMATCPADAVFAVRKQCHWVSRYPGGGGALRELIDLIVAAKQA
jgi:3-deoxy-D-manno-octulosonate 8-phosphate phosphatase (KDO 8-P phosphatase)